MDCGGDVPLPLTPNGSGSFGQLSRWERSPSLRKSCGRRLTLQEKCESRVGTHNFAPRQCSIVQVMILLTVGSKEDVERKQLATDFDARMYYVNMAA